jgi:cyclopropane-fatty-acyl-phospholipid synthase
MTNLLASADVRINGDRPWDIQVHDRRFFGRVLASGTLGFGESYMDGWWDCDALDEMCCRAIRSGLEKRFAFRLPNVWALFTALLANQQTSRRSRKVGRVHYDLSNDFFEAMLDPNMQYSCALFAGGDDLASAQLRKLDWICERPRLRPGLRLLDIGCGWGGLARYAARRYGCQVVGITISQEQSCYAQRWCRGLDVEIQLRDYREVIERFDRTVSVGMVEHVGYKNYRTYMQAAARSLGKDGLFLCQGICGNVSRVHADPWITRYIFPNSMLPSLSQLTRAAESVFIVEDIRNMARITTRHCSPGRKTSAAPGLALQIATANVSGECGDFTCSVARAHFGRAVYRSIRFSFRRKLPALGMTSATRDRPRPQRVRQFSTRAHSSLPESIISLSRRSYSFVAWPCLGS